MLNENNKKSFCPAHWDDIHFAPSQGYMQGCCKATPIPIDNKIELEMRRRSALNGVRVPACNYCWKTEDAGLESYRHFKLSKWDGTQNCRLLTLNLGNLCNLQCVYCNEKYSSKWQTDKKKFGKIPLTVDSDVYYSGDVENKPSQVYIDFYNETQPTSVLTVTGGEPLIGTVFYDIMEACDLERLDQIRVSTNLCYTNPVVLKKLLELQDKVKIIIQPSLDTVNIETQERIRYGFNWQLFESNLKYLLEKTNVSISFNSLMTDQSVLGIYKMHEYVYNLKCRYPNRIEWFVSYCVQPRIHSFEVLDDYERSEAIQQVGKVLQELDNEKEITGLNGVLAALNSTSFDEALFVEQLAFYEEFNMRQK